MSISSKKLEVDEEPRLKDDLNYLAKGYPQIENEKTDSISSAEDQLTMQEAGDAALANAPWQYKLIALVTALLFPRKLYILLLC